MLSGFHKQITFPYAEGSYLLGKAEANKNWLTILNRKSVRWLARGLLNNVGVQVVEGQAR